MKFLLDPDGTGGAIQFEIKFMDKYYTGAESKSFKIISSEGDAYGEYDFDISGLKTQTVRE